MKKFVISSYFWPDIVECETEEAIEIASRDPEAYNGGVWVEEVPNAD